MIQIKTVSDFKKNLAVGIKLHAIYHLAFAGRDEKQMPIYRDEDKGTREVSRKQTNSFALKTIKHDGTTVDSWCSYPKATECRIENNKLTIYERDMRKFPGGMMDESNPEYAALPFDLAVLTYQFI